MPVVAVPRDYAFIRGAKPYRRRHAFMGMGHRTDCFFAFRDDG